MCFQPFFGHSGRFSSFSQPSLGFVRSDLFGGMWRRAGSLFAFCGLAMGSVTKYLLRRICYTHIKHHNLPLILGLNCVCESGSNCVYTTHTQFAPESGSNLCIHMHSPEQVLDPSRAPAVSNRSNLSLLVVSRSSLRDCLWLQAVRTVRGRAGGSCCCGEGSSAGA